MDAKDLACDDRRDRQGVKDIDECLPRLDVCTPLTLVVESIHYHMLESDSTGKSRTKNPGLTPCDIRTLVIPAQEEKVLWKLDLVAEQQKNRFE